MNLIIVEHVGEYPSRNIQPRSQRKYPFKRSSNGLTSQKHDLIFKFLLGELIRVKGRRANPVLGAPPKYNDTRAEL